MGKNGKQYLSEDEDLLGEIEKVGPPSANKVAQVELMRKLASIQIRAILRNRKTAHDLDESTRKYSLVLIAFALSQLALGAFAFSFEVENSARPGLGLFTLVLFALVVIGIFIRIFRKYDK